MLFIKKRRGISMKYMSPVIFILIGWVLTLLSFFVAYGNAWNGNTSWYGSINNMYIAMIATLVFYYITWNNIGRVAKIFACFYFLLFAFSF